MKQSTTKRISTGLLIAFLMSGAFLAGTVTGFQARTVYAQEAPSPSEFGVF